MKKRYEAIEIDRRWYVMDHKNPASWVVECNGEEDAQSRADLWEIVANPIRL